MDGSVLGSVIRSWGPKLPLAESAAAAAASSGREALISV